MSDYYVSLNLRASAAFSCPQLQQIATSVVGSLTSEIAAVNATISTVNSILTTVTDIYNTIAALESSAVALETLPASAAGLTTLGSVIAFCQGQATIMSSLGTTLNASVVKSAIRLLNDINSLDSQVTALNANLTAATNGLTNFEAAVTEAASKFPNCTVTL